MPYQRPPLSKAYLLGKIDVAGLHFRDESFFADNDIEIVCDEAVEIDRSKSLIHLRSGRSVGYDHLVLATGARNRPLDVEGSGLKGVHGLKSIADADAIASAMSGGARNAVVIGGGFIGMEFASVATALGMKVHVVELADRLMARALSKEMSQHFAEFHIRLGAKLHFGTGFSRILGKDGHVTAVELDSGDVLPAELVVYGIGVLPNSQLAEAAGIPTGNGILVNDELLTQDPTISAIGDCACFPSLHAGGPIRIESVQNAADQGRTVAARICGIPGPYSSIPWFWSDQGSLKLQIVGIGRPDDETVLVGDRGVDSFSILLFRKGTLVAVESVNRAPDFMMARKLLAGERRLTIDIAGTPGFDLKTWMTGK